MNVKKGELPEDYEPCGYDHSYEYDEARWAHENQRPKKESEDE